MRHFFGFLAITSLIAIAAIWGLLNVYIPQIIDAHTTKLLQFTGVNTNNIALPSPKIDSRSVTYSDITIDPDAFSTIEKIQITYDIFQLLRSGTVKKIYIAGPDLTGTIKTSGGLNIAGLNNTEAINIADALHPFQSIDIENGTLSILTDDLGGISLSYDIQAMHNNGTIYVTGVVRSTQRHMNLISNISGNITPDARWSLSAKINHGKIAFPALQASRTALDLTMKGYNKNISDINGSFKIGGLRLYTFPFQNAQGEFTLTAMNEYDLNLTAYSLKQNNIVMNLNANHIGNKNSSTGYLQAPLLSDILSYITEHNGPLPPNNKLTEQISNNNDIKNVAIAFKVEGLNSPLDERLIYRMKHPSQKGYIQGRLPLYKPK